MNENFESAGEWTFTLEREESKLEYLEKPPTPDLTLVYDVIFSLQEPLDNGPLFCEFHFYQRVAKPDLSKWTCYLIINDKYIYSNALNPFYIICVRHKVF